MPFNRKELLIYSGSTCGLLPTNFCHYHQGCPSVLMYGGEFNSLGIGNYAVLKAFF